MAEAWTKGEYRITNGIYEAALARRQAGGRLPRQDIVAMCRRGTGRDADGPVLMLLGMLTAARKALGLATLPEFAPLAYYPRKLFRFLQMR